MYINPNSDLDQYLNVYHSDSEPSVEPATENVQNMIEISDESTKSEDNDYFETSIAEESKSFATFIKNCKLFLAQEINKITVGWIQPELENGIAVVLQELCILSALIHCEGSVGMDLPSQDTDTELRSEQQSNGLQRLCQFEAMPSSWTILASLPLLVSLVWWMWRFALCILFVVVVALAGFVLRAALKEATRQHWANVHRDVQLLLRSALEFKALANRCWRLVRNAQGISCGLRCSLPPPPVTRVEANRFAQSPPTSALALKGVRNILEVSLRKVLSKATHACFALSNDPIQNNNFRKQPHATKDALLLHQLLSLMEDCMQSINSVALLLCEELKELSRSTIEKKCSFSFESFQAPAILKSISAELDSQNAIISSVMKSGGQTVDMMMSAKEVFGDNFEHFSAKMGNLQAQYEHAFTKIFLWRTEVLQKASTVYHEQDKENRKVLVGQCLREFERLKAEELEAFTGTLPTLWLETESSLAEMAKIVEDHHPDCDPFGREGRINSQEYEDSDTGVETTQEQTTNKQHDRDVEMPKTLFEEPGIRVDAAKHPLPGIADRCTEVFSAVGGPEKDDVEDRETGCSFQTAEDLRLQEMKRQTMLGELLSLLQSREATLPPEKTVTEIGCQCSKSGRSKKCIIHQQRRRLSSEGQYDEAKTENLPSPSRMVDVKEGEKIISTAIEEISMIPSKIDDQSDVREKQSAEKNPTLKTTNSVPNNRNIMNPSFFSELTSTFSKRNDILSSSSKEEIFLC